MQQRILDALRSGANQDALAIAREFAAQSPDDPQAQRLLAMTLRANGEADSARTAMERAIALAPDDADLHFQHAGLLLGARDMDAARRALSTSVDLDPNQFGAYILQAHLALARNDLDEVERLARLAARVAPDHPWLQGVEGALALRRGDVDGAVEKLSRASAQAPDDPQLLHALGFAYLAKGHFAFAEQAFRSVLQKVPQAEILRGLIANVVLRQGRPAEAADELAPLLADGRTPTPALLRFAGELELAAGRPDRALPLLRDALAAAPGERRVVAAIAEAWRRTGDDEDARRTLDAALATSPGDDALWRARLGFEPAGPGADALVARWRGIRPDSVNALEAEMVMHAAHGRHDQVLALARTILEHRPGHPAAELRMVDAEIRDAPAEAVARIERLLATVTHPHDERRLRALRGLAQDRAGDFAAAVGQWSALQAARVAERLPLPEPTAPRSDWPPAAARPEGVAPVVFLSGLPGSLVERVARIFGTALPTFRDDRFSARPPEDDLQDFGAPRRLATGELDASAVAEGWRARLPARGIAGAVIDWLPWWDNAWALVLRAHLPEAMLLVALRDPRDMLLDWLAFGAPAPLRMESPQAAATWLAIALNQLALLHEQDLVPHRLLRLDDLAEDPGAMARKLGEALGIELPPPAADLFGAPRFAPGHWREYATLLEDAFAILSPVARRLGYPES